MPPTQTVTSDDARRFRESASVPLIWEESVPPPPIDRIEFTRRILEAARKTGFDVSAWNTSIADKDPEKKFEAFQKDIETFLPMQGFQGIPTVTFSIWTHGHASCVRTLNWGEYIEQLEREYFGPWERGWKFGASATSRQNLRDWLLDFLSHRPEISADNVYVAHTAYPNAEQVTGDETIFDYLHLHDGNGLFVEIRDQVGAEIPIIKERQFGLPIGFAMFLPPTVGLLCIISAIYGAFTHLFSGWWLLLVIPLIVVGAFHLFLRPTSRHWQNKSLTFNELFDQIIAAKKRDWAELQHVYKDN